MPQDPRLYQQPGLDQNPMPVVQGRLMEHAPCCGRAGELLHFVHPNYPPQVHVVHRSGPCSTCGHDHVQELCVLKTWPPTGGPRSFTMACSPGNHPDLSPG